ncbi:MAG: T4 RnlA family RNA ligase [Cetobacterium sp.]|uniref:T4 RnlA family RNA ligase n=1 Tax=Cetobacterium sp. TaxID=2071632 RepID=UPI003EE50ABC
MTKTRTPRVSRHVTKLFKELSAITKEKSIQFVSHDYVTGMGTKVRVFDYVVAAACNWKEPSAKEARGIMFEMDETNTKPLRIMCRPMEKFFNIGEPDVIDYNWDECQYYTEKADGSLISTFEDKGVLDMKSMSNMFTEVAMKAKVWLNDHPELKARLLQLCLDGYTANMEFVGPSNQNVLSYDEDCLILLNVRHNQTGEYVDVREIRKDAILRQYLTGVFPPTFADEKWANHIIEHAKEIEGFVASFPNGHVKVKTKWYFEKHAIRSAINSNREVVKMVFDENTDDLRAMFADNPNALKKINAFEMTYINRLEYLFTTAIEFKEKHKHLDRKSYAAVAQSEFVKKDKMVFDVVMTNYATMEHTELLESIKRFVQFQWRKVVPAEYAVHND